MRHISTLLSFFCTLPLLLLISIVGFGQHKPLYDSLKGFYDYQKKINDYYNQVGRIRGYNQWKRQEWYFETRVDKNGKMVNMQQLNQQAIQKAALVKSTRANRIGETNVISGDWNFVGPIAVNQSNEGIGRVNRFAFHPTNANILWAATAAGGLWKTTTAGNSWFPLTDGLPNLNLSGVAVNPQNPNSIYILTGDGDAAGVGADRCCSFSRSSTGVLKSVDGGATWEYTGLKWDESVGRRGYKLVMHPSDTNRLFVATTSGLYRTDNGGFSWTQTFSSLDIFDIEFMPNNSQVVYFGTDNGQFYRSTNGGLNFGVQFTSVNPLAGRVSIAVTPDNSSAVYMLISNDKDDDNPDSSYTFNGLYYSDSMGVNGSWIKRESVLPNVFGGDGTVLVDGQQNYDHALAVSPINVNQVITGGIRLFISANGGNTLNLVSDDATVYHVDIHDLAYGPSGNTLYAATDGGIYKSNNFGATWSAANTNLAITQYYRIAVTPASSTYILGGSQDNGSHLRNINSAVFQEVYGKDGMDCAIGQSDPSIMYVSAQHTDFYKSYNGGVSFGLFCSQNTLEGYNINVNANWVNNIVLHPTNDNTVYIGYQPIIRGIDVAGTWIFSPLGIQSGADISGRNVLNVARTNPDVIYAGSNKYETVPGDQALWRSDNGGINWTPLPVPDTFSKFSRLVINPDDAGDVWLVYGGYTDGRKVYRSTNGGGSWNNITGSLPNVPVNCIVYDDNNGSPNDALYIGTDIGVFYRDDELGDWIPFSNGLPVVEVTDLEINESAGLLRAGTYGRGVWQTSLYDGTCSSNLTISATSHDPSTPGFYTATSTITSRGVIIGAGASVQYRAGQRITLIPGFSADASTDAKFLGFLGPCPSGGVPSAVNGSSFNGLRGYLKE
jgi:hypothetical protein